MAATSTPSNVSAQPLAPSPAMPIANQSPINPLAATRPSEAASVPAPTLPNTPPAVPTMTVPPTPTLPPIVPPTARPAVTNPGLVAPPLPPVAPVVPTPIASVPPAPDQSPAPISAPSPQPPTVQPVTPPVQTTDTNRPSADLAQDRTPHIVQPTGESINPTIDINSLLSAEPSTNTPNPIFPAQ